MPRTLIGILVLCLFLCSTIVAQAADTPKSPTANPVEDSGENSALQKRIEYIIHNLAYMRVFTIQPKQFFDPKTPTDMLNFAAFYVENRYQFSKVRIPQNSNDTSLGELIISLQDVKSTIKLFFDYDLPTLSPGKYERVYFDGKDFHLRMATGGDLCGANVTKITKLSTGNLAAQGIFTCSSDDEDKSYAFFEAELKPMLWKDLHTYAVVSLTHKKKGE